MFNNKKIDEILDGIVLLFQNQEQLIIEIQKLTSLKTQLKISPRTGKPVRKYTKRK